MTYLEDALAHGMARHRAGQLFEAQSMYESLLSQCHDPKINSAALSHLADIHLRALRFDEAREAAGRAMRINGGNGTALLAAAQVERSAGKAENAIALLKSKSTHHLPPALIYEMGLCWHSLGQFRRAFLCFKESKRRISFADLDVNRGILTQYMDRLARRFNGPETLSWTGTPPHDRPDPVFIIGFNESGVSKLARMLDGHPGFGLAPELPAMDAARRGLGRSDPDDLHTLDSAQIQTARARYFQVIDQRVPRTCVPVDAMPLNTLALGLIHRLFPAALVLRCVRHPCEAVLRTFVKPYALNAITCHYDRLERTATTLMATTAVSNAIEESLSMTVHTLHIEEFLAAPQETVAAIARGVGLDPTVEISTPPMSPVDQWPRYRAEMSRWIEPLTALAERQGYPAK
jgi:tetratricopeptide (TPR) repeat protein